MRFPGRIKVLKRALILIVIACLGYYILQFYPSSTWKPAIQLSGSSLGSKAGQHKRHTTAKNSIEKDPIKFLSTDFAPSTNGEVNEMLLNVKKDANREPFIDRKESTFMETLEANSAPCYNLHIFYYPWYCSMKIDGKFKHWNHESLPHWDKIIDKQYDKKIHKPPNDIASSFYPELGAYSSRDPHVIKKHFEQIATAGVGVIVVSYYPPGYADDNGKPWDDIYLLLLNEAVKNNMKVTFQIEPYKNRNEDTVKKDIMTIVDGFGSHEGFYKHKSNDGVFRPLIYVYDSYQTKPEEWSRVLHPQGQNSIRGSKYDALIIGLIVELDHIRYVTVGGFDGMYTYFATNGFTFGSTWQNWIKIASHLRELNSLFIPSVGPGYDDTSIRPWNGENKRDRANGAYYKNSWNAALEISPEIISITSFNEWHEGTQIEKAVPKISISRKYDDYKPFESDLYLELTEKFKDKFKYCKKAAK